MYIDAPTRSERYAERQVLATLAAALAAPARRLAEGRDLGAIQMGNGPASLSTAESRLQYLRWEHLPPFFASNKLPILSLPDSPLFREVFAAHAPAEARRREEAEFASLRAEYELVRRAWEAEGIEGLCLKAVGLAPTFPHTSDNLDIYLLPELGDAARQALRRLGFVELRNIEEPNKYLFKRFRFGREFCAVHMHLCLEWSVSFLHERQVWERRRSAPDDPRLRVPAPEDGLLITLAHALYENKCLKLGDLMRVNHCLSDSHLDWDLIWETARSKGWTPGLATALILHDRMDRALYAEPALPAEALERAWTSLHGRRRERVAAYAARRSDFPAKVGFVFSKGLFFEKMLRDENEPWSRRLKDVGTHLVTGTKLKLHLKSQPAMLVSLSGLDGSGKSCQAEGLESAFALCAIKTQRVWSRGGSSSLAAAGIRLGKGLLRLLERGGSAQTAPAETTEASRSELFRQPLARRLWPWLIALDLGWTYLRDVRWPLWRGRVVICDRYVPDALADLSARMEQPEIAKTPAGWLLRRLNPRPQRAFFLDVPIDEVRRRQAKGLWQGTQELAERQRAMYNLLMQKGDLEWLDGTPKPSAISDRLVYEVLTDYFDGYRTLLNGLLLSNPKACSRGRARAVELPDWPEPMPFAPADNEERRDA